MEWSLVSSPRALRITKSFMALNDFRYETHDKSHRQPYIGSIRKTQFLQRTKGIGDFIHELRNADACRYCRCQKRKGGEPQ